MRSNFFSRTFSGAVAAALTFGALALSSANAVPALEPKPAVKLRALDKITGNSTDLVAKVGQTLKFGHLTITVRSCQQAPPEDTPESAAFLEVRTNTPLEKIPLGKRTADRKPTEVPEDGVLIFSGWMFASSPGLSALEHPTYDVWVISCMAS
ncbi:MAG: DUF2155 domain-containing protein [Hyphomonadaceae bacterium]